jgi:hypothetical protein
VAVVHAQRPDPDVAPLLSLCLGLGRFQTVE